MNKDWMYVALTCLFELLWVYGFNVATTWWHWGILIVIILADFYFLSKACENLQTGTVYAIFAGVGTVGAALMDVFILGGNFSLVKGIFMVILVAGVIGLKLADNQKNKEKNQEGVYQ
ncbi:DMT family transporter [Aneurinibacillus sp. REN35]|uniref:DMT family transporter n=1 Tax=Aneurinibacillus sp. REN35 TaxID=3237286 RepID=UPI003528F505